MKKILFLLFFITNAVLLFAQTESVIVFDSKSKIFNIGTQVYFFEDEEGKLTIEDIQKPEYQSQFKKSDKETPNFNITRSKIWVKLRLANQTDEKIYLEIAQAIAWYIDFYKPDAEGKPILTTQTGMMRPFGNREVNNNFFLFELAQNPNPQNYYFSIQSEFPLNFPLTIAAKQALSEKNYLYIWFFGMFAGLMLIMLFYNLFLFFSFRDRLYLYYCSYLVATLLIINFVSGNYAYKLQPISYFPNYLILFAWFNITSIVIFVIHLLGISKKQVFYKVLSLWTVLFFFAGIFNLVTGHYIEVIRFAQGGNLLMSAYMLYYGVHQYLKGNPQARFLVFGFSFYLISVIIFISQNLGFLVSNFFTAHAVVFGTSIEILMFSLALTNKINVIRKEKELAQIDLLKKTQENERILAEQNELLAQKVAEKTKDIQLAFEEIQVSNEELHQIQEEILAQKDLLEEKNITLEIFSNKITASIQSAKMIQKAILPSKETMKEFFADHFIIFKPKDVVSGDFWWINQIENTKYLVVADCTGHGVSGAFMTMIANGLLDQIVRVSQTYEPQEILANLNKQIRIFLQQEQTHNNDGMDIGVLRIEADKMVFAGAKRPLYFTKNKKIEKIAGAHKSIGGRQNERKVFSQTELTWESPSTFYLSTDGYADQNDLERIAFSEKRLLDLLEEIQDLPMAEQKKVLKNQLQTHMTGTEQRDDILVIGLRL